MFVGVMKVVGQVEMALVVVVGIQRDAPAGSFQHGRGWSDAVEAGRARGAKTADGRARGSNAVVPDSADGRCAALLLGIAPDSVEAGQPCILTSLHSQLSASQRVPVSHPRLDPPHAHLRKTHDGIWIGRVSNAIPTKCSNLQIKGVVMV